MLVFNMVYNHIVENSTEEIFNNLRYAIYKKKCDHKKLNVKPLLFSEYITQFLMPIFRREKIVNNFLDISLQYF